MVSTQPTTQRSARVEKALTGSSPSTFNGNTERKGQRKLYVVKLVVNKNGHFPLAEGFRLPCQATEESHMFSLSRREVRHQCGKTQGWSLVNYNPRACLKFRHWSVSGDMNNTGFSGKHIWIDIEHLPLEGHTEPFVAHPLSYNGLKPRGPH